MNKVYVFGHKNPDTDSVCGAISTSYLKNKLGLNTEPRILGEINEETKYALDYFGFDIPKYLDTVKVKIKDIKYHKNFYVKDSTSIYDTYCFMNENNITGIPIIDVNKKFDGYVSLKEIAKNLIINNNHLNTTFQNIVNILNSKKYVKSSEIISGNIIDFTYDETIVNNILLDDNSIIITHNKKELIEYAIKSNVKLIILINDHELDEKQVLDAINNNVNVITTPYNAFDTIKYVSLSNNIDNIKRNENCICLDPDDYLSDLIEISNKVKHTNYPIVNKNGICYGMLRLIDTNEYNKNSVILVDHNEARQSVDGIDEANILEIIDHHNISGITTKNPISFRNMSVGSVNTIIYYLYKENNIDIPDDIAGLMVSGILSDTIILNSPTTTIQDKLVVTELCDRLNLDYNEYGMNLLRSGMDISGKTIKEIIYSDYKTYTIDNNKFSIGQVLTVDFNSYDGLIDDIRNELNNISNNNDFKLVTLFITNILSKKTMVIYNDGGKKYIKEAYNLNDIYEGVILDDILSRKKQIVPNIIDALERI